MKNHSPFNSSEINVHLLRTFYVLAKKGSFSRTAEELCVTQPAISIHIKTLEDYYGVGLFDKVDKKYVLTEAGKALYHYTERIFNLIDESKRTLSGFIDFQRGSLSLGASSNIGVYILPCLLGDFKNIFPKINIQVSIGNTKTIEQKILNNEIDIGLVEAQIRSPEVVIEHWREEKLVLVTSPKHPFVKLKKVKPSQLTGEPFIVGERGSGTRRVLQDKIPSIVDHLKIFLELGSTEAVKKAVEENLGVSIVGENTVTRELKSGSLKSIQIDGVELKKKYNIIYLKGKIFTPVIKEFINYLHTSKC
ncbi:MAG: LysR family transcriptional regulator [Nitrospirota bacterium]